MRFIHKVLELIILFAQFLIEAGLFTIGSILALIGSAFGLLCIGCVLPAFELLIFIKKPWPLIFVIFLAPFALILFVFGNLCYALSVVFGILAWFGTGKHYTVDHLGIHIITVARRPLRILAWSSIKEVRKIFSPPFDKLQVVLQSDEILSIDLINRKKLSEALELYNIPFVCKGWAVDDREI